MPEIMTDGIPEHILMSPAEVIARTAWGEARGAGYNAMQGVMNVICNRAAHPQWWGHDIISVCFQNMQFDCWLPSDPNREKLLSVGISDPQFSQAMILGRMAASGVLRDITKGSDSYYSIDIPPPYWAKPEFFRDQFNTIRFYQLEKETYTKPAFKAEAVSASTPALEAAPIPIPLPATQERT